jgi:hypothetical protein
VDVLQKWGKQFFSSSDQRITHKFWQHVWNNTVFRWIFKALGGLREGWCTHIPTYLPNCCSRHIF